MRNIRPLVSNVKRAHCLFRRRGPTWLLFHAAACVGSKTRSEPLCTIKDSADLRTIQNYFNHRFSPCGEIRENSSH